MGQDRDDLRPGLASGDPSAYRAAYDRFGPVLYRTAARVLGNRADAEDAVQEVFAALVRSRDRIRRVEDLAAYLFVSLRRAALRIKRLSQRQPRPGLEGLRIAAKDGQTDGPEIERLWQAARQLPEDQREVLALKVDAELTFAQIGTILGVSPNTAASRYRYALQKLRQMLEGDK